MKNIIFAISILKTLNMEKWHKIIWFSLLILLAGSTIMGRFYADSQHFLIPIILSISLILNFLSIYILYKQKRLIRNFVGHIALLFIILGLFTTHFTAQRGICFLQQNTPNFHFIDNKSNSEKRFPFSVTATTIDSKAFHNNKSTNNQSIILKFQDSSGEIDNQTISFNKIAKKENYRFYFKSFRSPNTVVLQVVHDPLGIGMTYIGYLLLLLAFFLSICHKKSYFRQLISQNLIAKLLVIFTFLLATTIPHIYANGSSKAETLSKEKAKKFCEIYVNLNNRICPLQTIAQEFTTTIYGKKSYNNYNAEQVLCGFFFFPNDWKDEPIIKIDKFTKKLIKTSESHISLAELLQPNNRTAVACVLDSLSTSSKEYKKMMATEEKILLIAQLCSGELFKIFPITDNTGKISWVTPSHPLPDHLSEQEILFIRKGLEYAKIVNLQDEVNEFNTLINNILVYQRRNAQNALPSLFKIQSERCYNRIQLSRGIAITIIVIGMIFTLTLLRKNNFTSKRIPFIITIFLLTTFLYLMLLFSLRWIISGSIPISNGYETMLFLALCFSISAVISIRKSSLSASISTLLIGFSLLTATLAYSSSITQLSPVLDSPWLSVHVTTIMISYTLFGLITLNSIVALYILWRRADFTFLTYTQRNNLLLLYPAIWLLVIGIILGSIWANQSWGSYWSWDPKEVWALISALVYLYPLQSQLKEATNAKNFHIYIAFAFFSILFTYFGVNHLLGGLHSYVQ